MRFAPRQLPHSAMSYYGILMMTPRFHASFTVHCNEIQKMAALISKLFISNCWGKPCKLWNLRLRFFNGGRIGATYPFFNDFHNCLTFKGIASCDNRQRGFFAQRKDRIHFLARFHKPMPEKQSIYHLQLKFSGLKASLDDFQKQFFSTVPQKVPQYDTILECRNFIFYKSTDMNKRIDMQLLKDNKCKIENFKAAVLEDFVLEEDFVSLEEEKFLFGEVQKTLGRLKYEYDHWDFVRSSINDMNFIKSIIDLYILSV